MRVAQGGLDVLMPEDLLQVEDLSSVHHVERGEGVPQVVEADGADASLRPVGEPPEARD